VKGHLIGLVMAAQCLAITVAGAQTLTAKDVETHVRETFEILNTEDLDKLVATGYNVGTGFGYRGRDARSIVTRDEALAGAKAFRASVEFIRSFLDEVHTKVDGDVGVAWGFYTEEFQVRGRQRERVRARFSWTMRREGAAWRTIFFHRDAQPFDARGRYIPSAEVK